MRIEQHQWTATHGWLPAELVAANMSAQLVLAFGATDVLRRPELAAQIRNSYPAACVFGCSTAGEICDSRVSDDSLVLTAVKFEKTVVTSAWVSLVEVPNSFEAGERLAQRLPRSITHPATGQDEPLVHVLALTDGLKVNGSDFVEGLTRHLPAGVSLTGGLAGDGDRFSTTLVFRDGVPETDTVAAIGLYGNHLKVGFGSLGGWDPFGPERLVTRSMANVLYELDGHSALGLYKRYLGEHAQGLPATGLLFPLSVRTHNGAAPLVRTILAVDEEEQSLTFAGDVPQGAYARLMKANFDRLIDGAAGAARASHLPIGAGDPELALLISCVGRKLVLQQRTDDEVEAVRDVLGQRPTLAGFYSYGEISPFAPGASCELHNQTMTITTLSEV